MNCMEFRRIVDTDPGSKDEDFIRHKAECESCAAFSARAARFSVELDRAVRFDAPENLASRILLKQSFLPSRTSFSRRRVLALAASLVAAVGLAVSAAYIAGRQDPLAREIFTLIEYADYAMKPTVPLGEQPVARAVSRAGLRLEGKLEKVTFAGNCLLQHKIAGHLVIQGEKAPITVFLIREIELDAEMRIRTDSLRGIVVPVDGGAVAVVGARDEPLSELVERITSAVRWRQA